jgi:radical SAM protein with 4Fe4S-binding SPASM domain
MCPISQNNKNKAEVISDELFEKIIKEISQNQLRFTFVYLFLQNEPILDKDIFKKLKLVKKLSNGKLKTGIVTNGTLLKEEKIQELLDSKVDELIFSLDALTEETYNKIRQGLNFKNAMKNIENVIDSDFDKYLAVKFVLQKYNVAELKEFKEYWTKKGIPIQISPLNNRSGDLGSYNELFLKRRESSFLVKLKLNILNLVTGRIISKGCSTPITTFNILYTGDVILCCDDFSNKMILGNVNESTIKEIWNSKKYKEIRKMLYNGEREKISVCRTCSKISS